MTWTPEQIGGGLAGLGLIALSAYNALQSALAKREARHVRATLTTNNGGSHVKDSLDRIERRQEDHGAALESLKERVERLERRRLLPFL